MSEDGASNNERLLAAAKSDNEDLLLEVFEDPNSFEINFQDGLGNTALHYAAIHGSELVIEHILSHDECDVDPQNRIEGATPLHLAVRISEPGLRFRIAHSLLEAGADTTIKTKKGTLALDLVPGDDAQTRKAFRDAQAEAAFSRDDVVDDSDGEPGSDSVASDED